MGDFTACVDAPSPLLSGGIEGPGTGGDSPTGDTAERFQWSRRSLEDASADRWVRAELQAELHTSGESSFGVFQRRCHHSAVSEYRN